MYLRQSAPHHVSRPRGSSAVMGWSQGRMSALGKAAETSAPAEALLRAGSGMTAAQRCRDQRRGAGSRIQEAKGRSSLHLPNGGCRATSSGSVALRKEPCP